MEPMMKIQISTLLTIFFILFCGVLEVQADSEVMSLGSISECYQEYLKKTEPGYRSFALAIDSPYFICGFTWGAPKADLAVNGALYFCEQGRIHPQSETKGKRYVMTHCRIYASDLVE